MSVLVKPESNLIAGTKGLSEYFKGNVKPATLNQWITQGKGPKPIYIGAKVFFRVADVEAWIKESQPKHERKKNGRPKAKARAAKKIRT